MKYDLVTLGEVAEWGSGGTPSRTSPEYYGGDIPWIKTGDLGEKYLNSASEFITESGLKNSSAKYFPKGSIAIAMYGATIGKTSILNFSTTTNQACAVGIPNKNIISTEYLYYFIKSQENIFIQKGQGGAQPNISQALIKEHKIPLPPLPEQTRIAAILDQADKIRQKRRCAAALADGFLRSVFLEMFGDPVSNPKGWEVRKFEEVGSLDRGKSKHRPRNDPKLLGGNHPLIQTGDVANCNGYIKTYTATYSDLGLAQSKKWQSGTLCITIAANIAKTGILTFDACFPDSVVGFLPNAQVTTEYVRFWLSFLQKILEDKAPESAQKNINLAILKSLEIPVPDIEKQRLFSKICADYYVISDKLELQASQADMLFQSLSQQFFNPT